MISYVKVVICQEDKQKRRKCILSIRMFKLLINVVGVINKKSPNLIWGICNLQ